MNALLLQPITRDASGYPVLNRDWL
uniref:Uncharacterized protein n=1 Tax=Anguilla anguilla TaxID=7936 RepID=A0A0E9PMM2_ANGAN